MERAQTERTRAAALTMGILAVAYSALSLFYFYEDFFRHLGSGSFLVDRSGIAVPVAGHSFAWTLLSPWRLVFASVAVALLAVSAQRLWRGRANARALSLLTLWGVVLPQVLWYTEFLVDWHGGQAIATALFAALAIVAMPTMLLYEGSETLGDWGSLVPGRGRLLASAIALGWVAMLGTELLDHSYQMPTWISFGAALASVGLAGAAISGILELRSWALWAGVGSALASGRVPVSCGDAADLGGVAALRAVPPRLHPPGAGQERHDRKLSSDREPCRPARGLVPS
jgi:hypothetical protein